MFLEHIYVLNTNLDSEEKPLSSRALTDSCSECNNLHPVRENKHDNL